MGLARSSDTALIAALVALATTACVSRDLSPELFACRTGGPCSGDGGGGDAAVAPDTLAPPPDDATVEPEDGAVVEDAGVADDDAGPSAPDATPPGDSGIPADGGVVGPPWWGGRARVAVTISATADIAATDAIELVIDHAQWVRAGLSNADGDDVRVVRWDGAQWVERDRVLDPGSQWGQANTRLWVRAGADIASGSSDTATYVYLGDSPPTPEAPANPAQVFLFYDDFESGNTNAWSEVRTSNGALTVQGATTHRGRFAISARVESGQGWASVQRAGVSWRSAITTFWLWLPTDHTALDTIPAFYCGPSCSFSAPFGQIGGVGLNVGTPVLITYATDGTGSFEAGNMAVSFGEWHRFELRTRADPTAGRSEVWIDGTLRASITGVDTRTQLERMDLGLFWKSDANTSATLFADDVFVRPWIASDPTIGLGPLVQR